MRPRIVDILNSVFGVNFFGSLVPGWIHMFAIGVVLAFYVGLREAKRGGLDLDRCINAVICGYIFSLIGARLFFVFQNFLKYYSTQPLNMALLWKGGMVSYGGIIGATLGSVIYLRIKSISIWKFLDCSAVGFGICVFFTRIGCFLNGCCFGKLTDLPWGVRYPVTSNVYKIQLHEGHIFKAVLSLPVHPSQIYSALLSGVLLFLVFYFYLRHRKKYDGRLFCFLLIYYSITRSIVEMLRGDEIRGFVWIFSTAQFVSLIAFISAIILLFWLRRRRVDC